MKKLMMVPNCWPCNLEECPPGFFIWKDNFCFKSEYHNENGKIKAFNEAGEYFCYEDGEKIIVQSVTPVWEEE